MTESDEVAKMILTYLPTQEIKSFDDALKFVRTHMVDACEEVLREVAKALCDLQQAIMAHLPTPEFASFDDALAFVRTRTAGASAPSLRYIARALYDLQLARPRPPLAPPEWLSLSQAVERGNGPRKGAKRWLKKELAKGSYPTRWLDEKGEQRTGPLPPHLMRAGKINWTWSAVTHGGVTLQRIEILFPRAGVTEEAVDREPGRPTIAKESIVAEGERLLAGGAEYRSFAAFVKAVRRGLKGIRGTSQSTVERHVQDLWDSRTA